MKAIIVFDIDDKYAKKLDELEVEYHIYHYENGDDIDEGRIEPKPMPEKKGQHHEIPANSPFPMLDGIAVLMDGVNAEYNEGWNDCIDELVGEKQ